MVVKGRGPTLLGRDWLSTMRLDWASIRSIATGKSLPTPDQLISEYQELFQTGAGTLKRFKAHLSLKEGARPVFATENSSVCHQSMSGGGVRPVGGVRHPPQGRPCRMGCSNRTSA